MKRRRLKQLWSMLLAFVMMVSMVQGTSITAYADREDGMECWSCGHYHWDEYCCGTCGACSAECTNTDCCVTTHCNECGKCKNEDSGFCEECFTCSDCHYDNGWHCLICEECYYTNESALCGKCWLCEDCRGGLCDTCGFCAECWAEEDDNMHCPECDNCYSAVEQCPNETNNHCVECCVFCEQCEDCLFEEGLELCEDCGLCEICCEMAAQEQDCDCGEYCVESSDWFEHLCMDCGTPYCQVEPCDICGLCLDCCASASECEEDPPVCVEDDNYEVHFCADCGSCFHVEEQCETCYEVGDLRCEVCCRILTSDAGCDCDDWCFQDTGFDLHLLEDHTDAEEGSHEATPKSEWCMDADNHWHECRYCLDHTFLDLNSHNLNKYGVCVNCGYDQYAKVIFLKQPQSKVAKVTDHNAYKGEDLNAEDNQVTFSVAAMDQTGNTDFSYQWYEQLNGTDENRWEALEDYTNSWPDSNTDTFSMVSGAKNATLKISVPTDACYTTHYYRCTVTTEIDGETITVASAPAALRATHAYTGEYIPIVDEYTKILFQPKPEDNIAMRETVIHNRHCIGDGCEEYKEEAHNYSKETKTYINRGPNLYGEIVGDGCEYIEYTCLDCDVKRYVKAHEHYFYDPETGLCEVDLSYENSVSHQLKCLYPGCEKITKESHVFMAWQIMADPHEGDAGIGSAYKECQLCGYQYTAKPQQFDPESGKNVSADWTVDNNLIYVQYGSASSDLYQRGDELFVTFSPTVNDKQEYIKLDNPVCKDWYIYYDADPADANRKNVTNDFKIDKITGQPTWVVNLKTSTIVQEDVDKWYKGGGFLIFEPFIDDAECTHQRGTRIAGAYEPVCIYEGYTGDKVCADCGYVIEEGEYISGGDKHEGELVLDPWTKREADCNHRGYTGTSRCTECNKPVAGKSTPRVHKETCVKGYQAPTCYTFGYSGDTYCSNPECGELIKEGSMLAPEHQNVSVVNHVAPTKTKDGYSGDLVCDDCDLVLKYGYTIHADRVIREVEIAGVDFPITGETPDYDVQVDPNAKYEIDKFGASHVRNGVSWYRLMGAYADESIHPMDRFERGEEYKFRVVLEKKSTYSFAGDADVTVNGEPAEAEVSKDGQYLYVEYAFPHTKANVVSEIDVQVPEPIPGELSTWGVDYNGTMLYLDGFGISDSSGESLNIEYDSFQEGETYNYFFQFVPLADESTGWNEACTFADQVTATVNGNPVKKVYSRPPLESDPEDYGAVWFEYSFGLVPDITTSVYALTNAAVTLADVADQLPSGWEWVDPKTKLSTFAGLSEKDFAVKYVNPFSQETTYDTVTVILSTISNTAITGLPEKVAKEAITKATLSYEVLGEPLRSEIKENLRWSVDLAPKAKTGIISYRHEDNQVTVQAMKAGTTTLLAELKLNGTTVASVTQKVTVVADKTGIATVDVTLVDAGGTSLTPKNGVYTVELGDTVYLKNNTIPSNVTGKDFKITYKSMDSAIVKPGKTDKEDATKTLLTLGKAGTTVITATANDTLKSSAEVKIKVVDKTNKSVTISGTTVNLNTALKNASAELKVYNGFGAFLKGVTYTTGICDVTYKQNGTIIFTENETTKKGGKITLDVVLTDGIDEVTQTFTVNVKVSSKKPSVTVKQLDKLDTFYKKSTAALSITSAGETIKGVTLKEADFGYSVAKEKEHWKIMVADASKLENKKCTLQIRVEGYDDPVEQKITIATESPKFALSANSGTVYGSLYNTMKVQLINNTEKSVMDLTGATVSVDNANYTASVDGNDILVTAKVIPEKSEKVTLKLNSSFWNESLSFTFTVKSVDPAKAKLQLGEKSLTLYNYGSGINNSISTALSLNGDNPASWLLKDVQITAADKKTEAVLNKTLFITYEESTSELKAKTKSTGPANGTYKVNLVLQNPMFTKDLKATLSVKVENVTDLSKCVTVTPSGKIDVLNRDGTGVELKPKFTKLGTNAVVKGYTLTGADAPLFEIQDTVNDVVTIRLKDKVQVLTKYNYNVSVAYEIESGDAAFAITSAPVKINLTQGKTKVTTSGINTFSSTLQESKKLEFTVTNSMGEKVDIESVKLLNLTEDFSYKFDAENQTGMLTHWLNGQTARGKNYTLSFEIYLKDRGTNEKPVTVTYKVQIVK